MPRPEKRQNGRAHLDGSLRVPQLGHHRLVRGPAEALAHGGGRAVSTQHDRKQFIRPQVVHRPRAVAVRQSRVLEDREATTTGEEGGCILVGRRKVCRSHRPILLVGGALPQLEPTRKVGRTFAKGERMAPCLGALGDRRIHGPVEPLNQLRNRRFGPSLRANPIHIVGAVLSTINCLTTRA
eukprot:scaffold59039_cov29-Tisochrysis_lutea.AAC.3